MGEPRNENEQRLFDLVNEINTLLEEKPEKVVPVKIGNAEGSLTVKFEWNRDDYCDYDILYDGESPIAQELDALTTLWFDGLPDEIQAVSDEFDTKIKACCERIDAFKEEFGFEPYWGSRDELSVEWQEVYEHLWGPVEQE
jgi:hypothetical protein